MRRVDGQNCCTICGEPGHGKARHLSTAKSVEAARAVMTEGLTLAAAAVRYRVSRQAVQQALRIYFGDVPTPAQNRRREARVLALLAAGQGKTVDEIVAASGMRKAAVYKLLQARGIQARNPTRLTEDEIAAAAGSVLGGSSLAEAAADLGRSPGAIGESLRFIGVRSDTKLSGRRDGRVAWAVVRILAGESMVDACRAERCARTTVDAKLKRMREAAP